MKQAIARETLLTYPDFNKPFEILTNASKVQLGADISQDGKPVTLYNRKVNPAQTRYTNMESELLSIDETLEEHSLTHSDYDHNKLSYRCIQHST